MAGSKREKLRRKLRDAPANARMRDVEALLRGFGFTLARTKGSHHIYEYDDGEQWRQIVIPLHGRKVKEIYVKKVLEMIDGLFPEAEGDE